MSGEIFALKVVKLVLAGLIIGYDMKLATKPTNAPTDWNMEGFFLPAKDIGIALRSREK